MIALGVEWQKDLKKEAFNIFLINTLTVMVPCIIFTGQTVFNDIFSCAWENIFPRICISRERGGFFFILYASSNYSLSLQHFFSLPPLGAAFCNFFFHRSFIKKIIFTLLSWLILHNHLIFYKHCKKHREIRPLWVAMCWGRNIMSRSWNKKTCN